MADNRRAASWAAVSALSVLVLGSGTLWKWQELKMQKAQAPLESVMKIAALRSQVSDLQAEMLQLVGEYLEAYDAYQKNESSYAYDAITNQQARLQLLSSDYEAIEAKLAHIENRPPRPLGLVFPYPGETGKPKWVK